jgi:hypothetical protein
MAQRRSRTLATLVLALLTAGASIWLGSSIHEIECERLPSLTVVAMLSAFVLALGFRQLARTTTVMRRWQLIVALLIAGVTLFGDVRFVAKYRGPCNQLQWQIHKTTAPAEK